ncbi:hypothetical protein [Shewanella surugensis]|uniref:Bacteriocin n=1 Tax=Shewanella surugensis TaxID=212020 RepID=A0ABT0LE44_9GAMM|nr:hypothetical protein [Shewanella surugensis]MCL1125963.1 hypothetical protein [Shewanella surugensis]
MKTLNVNEIEQVNAGVSGSQYMSNIATGLVVGAVIGASIAGAGLVASVYVVGWGQLSVGAAMYGVAGSAGNMALGTGMLTAGCTAGYDLISGAYHMTFG